MSTNRIQSYLPPALRRTLSKTAKERHISESKIISKALQRFFNLESDDNMVQVLTRRLDRQTTELKYLKQDIALLTETLSMFIRVYLSSTPEVPDEHKSAASRSGNVRYKKLVEAVANRLSQGKLFIDELPKETFLTEEDFIKASEKNEPAEKVDTIAENA